VTNPAVILMAYGSPDRLADVPAYYTDIRGGRPIAPEHLDDLVTRYRALGIDNSDAPSPLNSITEETRAALAQGVLEAEPDPAGFAAYAGIEPRARKRGPGAGGGKARAGRQGEPERRREQARLRAMEENVTAAEELVKAATEAEDEAKRARERAEVGLESARADLERANRSNESAR